MTLADAEKKSSFVKNLKIGLQLRVTVESQQKLER